jgi:hypothetical protein
MRKLFWGSLTCGVVLVGSVISTAHFAACHPESIIGRVLHGASYAAIFVNPVDGLESLAQEVRAKDPEAREAIEAVAGDPLPDDPEPVADVKEGSTLCAEPDELTCKPVAPGPVVETSGAAPIVIKEPKSEEVGLPMPETPRVDQSSVALDPASEYPGEVVPAAPSTMPPCEDDIELLPMPKPVAELLPMPHEDEEQESCDWMDLNEEQLLNYFRRGIEEMPGSAGKADSDAHPEWREDRDRHQDYPACPHGGCSPSGKPGSACPHQPAGDSVHPAGHSSEDPSEHVTHSALRKLSIFREHTLDEDFGTPHPEVDTMEYRSSDKPLYDFGHGPL